MNMSQLKMVRKETALKGKFKTFELNGLDDTDLKNYLEMASSHIGKQIKEEVRRDISLKVEISAGVNLARRSDGNIIKARPFFNSGLQIFTASINILKAYEEIKQKIMESFATYISRGSRWIFQSVENCFKKLMNIIC